MFKTAAEFPSEVFAANQLSVASQLFAGWWDIRNWLRAFLRRGRRPARVLPPDVAAGFNNVDFRQFGVAVFFQVLLKKRKDDVLAVICAGFGGKADLAQVVAIQTRPSAVDPRPHNQSAE